jgi:sugar/nucleoside kinase (ribokinase family)/fructoselysine-6-P-deglycase FrlB-like protein
MNEQYDSQTHRPRVIVVGNLTIDDVVLPDGTVHMESIGGNTLYSALGARLWQPDVGIVTRRGEDFPHDLTEVFAPLGIATTGVVNIPGPTVRNWVIYEHNGERHWLYRTPRERSREVAVQPGDLPPGWLTSDPPPVVHVAAMPLDAAEAIVDAVRRVAPSAVITLDTHEDYVADYRQRLRALAARVDAFLPSRSEVADLVGYDDPERALLELIALPAAMIVIKMGADGALVWDKRQRRLHQVGVAGGPVVDVTGAGDAFCGGFAAGLSLGRSPLEAAQYGTLSASYAVADFGSLRLAAVEPTEAQRRLSTHSPAFRQLAFPPALESVKIEGADRGIRSAIDVMREEIEMIPALLGKQFDSLAGVLYDLARRLHTDGIEHLYLVGCGDSAFAGSASVLAFQRRSGISAEGIHALDLARYRVRYLPRRSAVLCISFSGKVGRTIEAAKQARRFGQRVIALTGSARSPLAQEATDILPLSVPTLGYSPGTSTYLAILAALLQLSVIWGEVRGNAVQSAKALLWRVPDLTHQTLAETSQPALELAQRVARHNWLTFLGAGPNMATAQFGAAKLFEGPQKLGVATNIEEWAHEEYFISGAGTPVLLIAPGGAAFDRANEILSELTFIGADAAFISDKQPAITPTTFFPLAPGLPEEFSPLLAALPLSLFAFHLARVSGQTEFSFVSPEAAREHYETLHRVTMGEPA